VLAQIGFEAQMWSKGKWRAGHLTDHQSERRAGRVSQRARGWRSIHLSD
jgi:hypothetical protein